MSNSVTNSSVASIPTQPLPANLTEQMLELDEDDDLEVFTKDVSLTDGGSFSTSIPTSPASMTNQYKFEEEPDARDIFVTVDNPESHVTALETFITYRVVTKTTRSDFDSCEYEVRRRYQDFVWLKDRLEEAHPTLIIHPLPEKFVMKGMVERFNEDFIETRRKALHKFLNRIADHPILSYSNDFKVFLSAQAWELASHKKQGPGFLSRMGDTVRAVAAGVRGLKNRPEEFVSMQEYADSFGQKVTSLDKITQRILKEVKEYLEELKEYSPAYTLWSGSEEELTEPLNDMASCMERCSRATEERVGQLSNGLAPLLHEYVLCSDTLKTVLKRRDHIQAEYEAKCDVLANRKTDREALKDSKPLSIVLGGFLGKDPEETRQQRELQLETEIQELKQEVEKLEDRVEFANSALKVDWERWRGSMRTDVRAALVSTADASVDYYEKCLAVWESFLASQSSEHTVEKSGELSS